jgi:hypothetical protein
MLRPDGASNSNCRHFALMKSSPSSQQSEIRLTVNTIANGQWFTAGDPLPFTRETLPIWLKRYVDTGLPEEPEPATSTRNLAFKANKRYGFDADGNILRPVGQQMAEMETIEQEREAIEDALSSRPSKTVRDAVAQAEDDHAADVARQKAQAEFEARRRDTENNYLRQQQDADAINSDAEGFADANTQYPEAKEEFTPEPKPPGLSEPMRIRMRYVRRGNSWRKARKVACRVGEPVFIRNGPGDFEVIGKVSTTGKLPVAFISSNE